MTFIFKNFSILPTFLEMLSFELTIVHEFKVVLPLMHAYFNAHKNYFLANSSIVQTGMASDKEKEMVAR